MASEPGATSRTSRATSQAPVAPALSEHGASQSHAAPAPLSWQELGCSSRRIAPNCCSHPAIARSDGSGRLTRVHVNCAVLSLSFVVTANTVLMALHCYDVIIKFLMPLEFIAITTLSSVTPGVSCFSAYSSHRFNASTAPAFCGGICSAVDIQPPCAKLSRWIVKCGTPTKRACRPGSVATAMDRRRRWCGHVPARLYHRGRGWRAAGARRVHRGLRCGSTSRAALVAIGTLRDKSVRESAAPTHQLRHQQIQPHSYMYA